MHDNREEGRDRAVDGWASNHFSRINRTRDVGNWDMSAHLSSLPLGTWRDETMTMSVAMLCRPIENCSSHGACCGALCVCVLKCIYIYTYIYIYIYTYVYASKCFIHNVHACKLHKTHACILASLYNMHACTRASMHACLRLLMLGTHTCMPN